MLSFARTRRQRRRLEWGLLAIGLLGLVAWLSLPAALNRINHLVQDVGLRLVLRPAHPDIVVVAIDDRSIAAIGRWPWRRALHAQLIRQLSEQDPRAIGMDVLLNDPDLDYPEDDALLAHALQRSGRVVLPVMRRNYGPDTDTAELPWPDFARSAARLGHVHVTPDIDGIVRSLYLQEGPAAAPWPHFSVAMQCVAVPANPGCTGATAAPGAPQAPQAPQQRVEGLWQRTQHTPIAYGGGPGHFPTYSYIDVLRGQVPTDTFRGKYVLVGATASGIGDRFATPVSQQPHLMPGVEVVAHVLDARLSGVPLHPLSPWANMALNLLPVVCLLLALLLLGPSMALIFNAALVVATLVLSVALVGWMGLQFAPAAALTGLVLAYPLWSWRRLNAAAHFLRLEMERLQRDGLAMRLHDRPGDTEDFLERRINAVERASRQLSGMYHFVNESLQQLPSPTLVCNAQGRILLANMAACRHVGAATSELLQGRSVVDLLADIVHTATDQPVITENGLQCHSLPHQSEAHDSQGRALLVQCRPFTDLAEAGWLLTLVDLTDMHRALKQRDQAMNFISHDIRAPNASILTLLEMQRAAPSRIPPDELMQRIERYARASLGMAENFVQLASAQSQDYRMAALDLVAVLSETVDDLWALSRERGVHVNMGAVPETALCLGDRALLCRALANVVNNAIKFSPEGGTVDCSIVLRASHWVVAVRDDGPGIAVERQKQLFAPFQRLHHQSHPTIGGVGLGLALAHTVVQRHGGTLEVDSAVGRGTEFRLVLPQHHTAQREE